MLKLKTKTTIDWGGGERIPKSEEVEITKYFLWVPYSTIHSTVYNQNRPDDEEVRKGIGFNASN